MKIENLPQASLSLRGRGGSPAWWRGTALFFGAFTLLNLLVTGLPASFPGNLWWIDLRRFPEPVGRAFETALGIGLIWCGCFPDRPMGGGAIRKFAAGLTATASLVGALNTLEFWQLVRARSITTDWPLPATLVWTLALGLLAVRLARPEPGSTFRPGASDGPATAGVAILWALVFPLVQAGCFGHTDYRRPADVAVVFGARVYADGRLSDAVGDRVGTAVELYHQGLVSRLIFSGGPGDGRIHETEAMRRRAVALGVPTSAIALDPNGLNTAATVRETVPAWRGRRVLAVSEFYHLPRIKLAFAGAGLDVFTVPARASHWLRRWPLSNVIREVPAFWVYYFRPLFQRGSTPVLT